MERISLKDAPVGLYLVVLQVENYVRQSGLDPKLLHLMRYRVSRINHCGYCLDMHFKEAIHHGEDLQRLYSLSAWEECPYYSDKERAALAFAEALTELPSRHVDDVQFDRLSQFFSKEEIAILTVANAQINTWNRITQSFGTILGTYQVKKENRKEAAV